MGTDAVMGRRVGFACWRSELPSGGNRYDDELVTGLRALGLNFREYEVTGPWPLPELHDIQRLAELLTCERDWLIDNIVGSAAPDTIRAATGAGGRVTMLMHYFPADDPSLSASERERLAATEAQAVAVANRIVVTSAWAASEVSTRYGRHDAIIAVPGVEPAPVAPGSSSGGGPPMLLWLARLTPTKDPLTFVNALVRLRQLHWIARLVGPDSADEDLSRQVRNRITEAGLTERVEVAGERTGAGLEAVWADTDLLVHTSRAETYGMVVSEALARGIPSIVASGTGAVEAQGVGAQFPPGDADALAESLRSWLTDPQFQNRWRTEAASLRFHQPRWQDTAEVVASALAE